MVDAEGWRGQMPGFERAGAIIGEQRFGNAERPIAIHNGVHDSNAALHAYRRQGRKPVEEDRHLAQSVDRYMALAKHARAFIGLGLETAHRKAELVSAPHKP